MVKRSEVHAVHTVASIGEWAGGPSRTVTNLCSSLAKCGCKVDLTVGFDPARDGVLIKPSEEQVRLQMILARSIGRLKLFPGFGHEAETLARKASKGGASALIHDHGIWGLTNIAAAKAARRAAVPYVLHPRGMLEPYALKYKGHKKRLAWHLYQERIIASSAVLIATSDQERDNIKCLFPNLAVAVIPNGVPFPIVVSDRAQRPLSVRRNLLFLSRVHPKKNILGLVRAWREVCLEPSRANWVLQIAGPDELDHQREVKELVHSLGLDARVEFLGMVSEADKGALLNAADLFVLPSFSENFGIAVAEALAHGLPVVATHGTPWGGLVDRGCGWWVEPSPDALAQAMAAGVDMTPADRQAMGQRGREYAHTEFSWDRIGLDTMRLYEWVLGQGGATPNFVYL